MASRTLLKLALAFFLTLPMMGCGQKPEPVKITTALGATPTESYRHYFQAQREMAQLYIDQKLSREEWTKKNREMKKSFLTSKGRTDFDRAFPEVTSQDTSAPDTTGIIKTLMQNTVDSKIVDAVEKVDGSKAVVSAKISTWSTLEKAQIFTDQKCYLELEDGLWYLTMENHKPLVPASSR